jgi:hypothetical protein
VEAKKREAAEVEKMIHKNAFTFEDIEKLNYQ